MPPWSLQNSQNRLIFSHVEKNCQKKIFFCAGPPPPFELHIRIFSFSDSCTPVHWILFYLQVHIGHVPGVHEILFFLQTHVPGYMILCFFFKSMYPGTWNFDFSSNPCTPVHEIWILFHYLCIAQGVEVARCKKYFFFCQIFSTCKKIIQFLEFCKDQGGKI